MKYLALTTVFFAAALSGQAQALPTGSALVCNSANDHTNACIVQAACGGLKSRLAKLNQRQVNLKVRLNADNVSSLKAQRLESKLRGTERATALARKRFQTCKKNALS